MEGNQVVGIKMVEGDTLLDHLNVGRVRFDGNRVSFATCCLLQFNIYLALTTQHNTTQHNTTQHNTTQHNTTQHNTTYQCRITGERSNIKQDGGRVPEIGAKEAGYLHVVGVRLHLKFALNCGVVERGCGICSLSVLEMHEWRHALGYHHLHQRVEFLFFFLVERLFVGVVVFGGCGKGGRRYSFVGSCNNCCDRPRGRRCCH